ncbi:DMT family transporter [Flavobacterium sp.]|uniref:DMT family transporter n=1 Tax=Flavobacterium sp. TaxID=239 RepID=UPI0028BE0FDC|nr:DMT family transporter [Flavobacterium sp.]
MSYILLSICCSVSVAVLLKYVKRLSVSIEQIINLNYLAAIILCFTIFKPDTEISKKILPWKIYIPLFILLPAVFILLARSIKSIGIVKTDIAQRLSLFIPILAAYFIFDENISLLKLIGVAVGFTAIFFTLYKTDNHQTDSVNWLYPLLVFLGFGIIDVLFKQIAVNKEVGFTTSLFWIFIGSFVVASCISLFYIITKKSTLKFNSILWGILLGALNFGNIFFYLKAHQAFAENPTTVFASMNFGVIALGSFIGVIAFKEKLSKINYIGITLAIIAVVLITISQLNS